MLRSLLARMFGSVQGRPTSRANLHPLAASDPDDQFNPLDRKRRRRWRTLLRESGEAERLAALKDIHKGKRAFFIGNGPSIKGQDLTKLSSEVTFVTNWFVNHDDYDRVRPTYYCISSHEVFGGWNAKPPTLNGDLRGRIAARDWKSHHVFPIWAREAITADSAFERDQTHFLIFERPKAEISRRGTMNWDVMSNLDDGYTGIVTFCLPLAYHMGIREVYLLGCDCDYQIKAPDDPKAYFYDFKKHSTTTSKFETLDRIWGPGGEIFTVYEIVRREAEARGMSVRNATAGGLLEIFERVSYESLVGEP